MIEIRIHGRGGQGGVTLAKLLAAAEHREGKSVQAFGVYAAERSGAPVQAFLRIDDEPIHNPNQIYKPDHLIVLDPTLISPVILGGLKPGGFILFNCDEEIGSISSRPIILRHGRRNKLRRLAVRWPNVSTVKGTRNPRMTHSPDQSIALSNLRPIAG